MPAFPQPEHPGSGYDASGHPIGDDGLPIFANEPIEPGIDEDSQDEADEGEGEPVEVKNEGRIMTSEADGTPPSRQAREAKEAAAKPRGKPRVKPE